MSALNGGQREWHGQAVESQQVHLPPTGTTISEVTQIFIHVVTGSLPDRDYLPSTTSIPERSNSSLARGTFPAASASSSLSIATI